MGTSKEGMWQPQNRGNDRSLLVTNTYSIERDWGIWKNERTNKQKTKKHLSDKYKEKQHER